MIVLCLEIWKRREDCVGQQFGQERHGCGPMGNSHLVSGVLEPLQGHFGNGSVGEQGTVTSISKNISCRSGLQRMDVPWPFKSYDIVLQLHKEAFF